MEDSVRKEKMDNERKPGDQNPVEQLFKAEVTRRQALIGLLFLAAACTPVGRKILETPTLPPATATPTEIPPTPTVESTPTPDFGLPRLEQDPAVILEPNFLTKTLEASDFGIFLKDELVWLSEEGAASLGLSGGEQQVGHLRTYSNTEKLARAMVLQPEAVRAILEKVNIRENAEAGNWMFVLPVAPADNEPLEVVGWRLPADGQLYIDVRGITAKSELICPIDSKVETVSYGGQRATQFKPPDFFRARESQASDPLKPFDTIFPWHDSVWDYQRPEECTAGQKIASGIEDLPPINPDSFPTKPPFWPKGYQLDISLPTMIPDNNRATVEDHLLGFDNNGEKLLVLVENTSQIEEK